MYKLVIAPLGDTALEDTLTALLADKWVVKGFAIYNPGPAQSISDPYPEYHVLLQRMEAS